MSEVERPENSTKPTLKKPSAEGSPFFIKEMIKSDNRKLFLFSLRPLANDYAIEKTLVRDAVQHSHLRWHPLRGEWVAYASHRQGRTFLPPKEYNPLAPMTTEIPTELPPGDYDVAVFQNMFPSLDLTAVGAPDLSIPTQPGIGSCEVVVFTQQSETSLGELALSRIKLVLEVLAFRYVELSKELSLKYILPFENRGVEVGVTLNHPHGQIYAYPFLPPFIQQITDQQKVFWKKNNKSLLKEFVEAELKDKSRLIHEENTVVAFIPVCARYTYEVWIAPKRHVTSMDKLTQEEMADLAKTLKTVLLKYDGLWNKKFPYLMAFFNAPTGDHPEWHFHIQFFPPLRTKDRLKYLAGTELAAGMFVNDSLPEEKAKELQAIEVIIND